MLRNSAQYRESSDIIEHRSLRQRQGRGRARLTLNLTTMIDVVFLLLIYFMVATKFKVGEEVYQLDLPKRLQSDQQDDPFELDEQPLVITVASTGPAGTQVRLLVEGPMDFAGRSPTNFDQLYDVLRHRQIDPAGASTMPMFEPDYPIIIQPAATATWDHAIGAFNAAARARYTNLKFAQPQ